MHLSLDCKEGHIKRIRLFVCLFASGSKEHRFKNSLIVINDGWDLVGPWVIEVGECGI